ncbi:MAG: hypothetical protein JKY65_12090 [Planctomycetes bacterium]|nr:hypothetical protein [Planctomycetota bacterium]
MTLSGEALGKPWTLPTFDGDCQVATLGLQVVVVSKRQIWALTLPSKERRTLPPLPISPRHVLLFSRQDQIYLVVATKKEALCGPLGGELTRLDLGRGSVEAMSTGGGRAVFLTHRGGLARGIVGFDFAGTRVFDWKATGFSTPESIALSPRGDRAFLGFRHGQLAIRSGPHEKNDSHSLGRGHELGVVRSVAWSTSGGRLAAVSKETLSVWDVDRPNEPIFHERLPPGGKGDFVGLSPSGKVVVVSRNEHHIGWSLPAR